jgi:hypothetical protein
MNRAGRRKPASINSKLSNDDSTIPDEDTFYAEYEAYLQSRGRQMDGAPVVMSKPIDLYLFYTSVLRRGGYTQVSSLKKPESIYIFGTG